MSREKSLNIDEVNKFIKTQSKMFEKLTKAFTKIQEAEQKASKIRQDNFQQFENMEKIIEDDNPTLKELYKNFGKNMKELENMREDHLKTLKELIIPVTEFYPTKLKKNKMNLDEISKAKKNTENLRKSQADGNDITKSERTEISKRNNFEKEFLKYEKERVEDNRFLFLNYIHSELKYHCAVLEELSKLFVETNKRNVTVDLKNFAENYSIKNYNFKKLGIDMNNLNDQVIEEENERKRKINSVYTSGRHSGDDDNEDDDEDDDDDDNIQDSFQQKKKSSIRKTKNSQIKKSQNSHFDNKRSSRKIQDDE
jgi:hypothetical protein